MLVWTCGKTAVNVAFETVGVWLLLDSSFAHYYCSLSSQGLQAPPPSSSFWLLSLLLVVGRHSRRGQAAHAASEAGSWAVGCEHSAKERILRLSDAGGLLV